MSCVGLLCGPPLRWWVLCRALPSVWVPCLGPLCGSAVWVPSVWVPCVGPLCGSPVALRLCGIYSCDVSRSFTRSRSLSSRVNRKKVPRTPNPFCPCFFFSVDGYGMCCDFTEECTKEIIERRNRPIRECIYKYATCTGGDAFFYYRG